VLPSTRGDEFAGANLARYYGPVTLSAFSEGLVWDHFGFVQKTGGKDSFCSQDLESDSPSKGDNGLHVLTSWSSVEIAPWEAASRSEKKIQGDQL
jgi:hypothetical protein